MIVKQSTRQIAPTNIRQAMNNAAANTAVTVTVAALADKYHVLHKIVWSYNNTVTAGGMYVQNGAGNNVFEIDITASGPGGLDFNYDFSANTALIVTLKAAGASTAGRLNIEYSTEC